MAVLFRRVVLVGVGLIGGSFALAARRKGLVGGVVGIGRGEKNLRYAQRRGIIDRYVVRPSDIPADTDLLMMGTPVRATVPLAKEFLPWLKPGCVVTDVGSVKEEIVLGMERLLPRELPFVGAHPIAGGEQWGARAATADLFEGRRCILTPTRRTDAAALRKVAALWRGVGARVETMDPAVHDRVFGVVSHLPHVLVYALVGALGRTRIRGVDLKSYCAGGFKDFTRIASSRPELWRDICLMNRRAVGKALSDYIGRLQEINRWIRDGRGDALEREFARANEIRAQIP
ncbi:MAG TPA: prephenate dehydrogenase/arogenate dehydrogenase family protein [candidate division Zixibacteria bacterium]|nr:prephenate dehydrogenase/arogenate dehydrogenase family protein [candidate division Zixibacteria bacterium]